MAVAESLVYLISSGAYSDYSPHCVFALKENAEAYMRAHNRERLSDDWEWRTVGAPHSDWDDWHIEPLQFWGAGIVPHVEAAP
jgi:hypothetical protein